MVTFEDDVLYEELRRLLKARLDVCVCGDVMVEGWMKEEDCVVKL